MIVSWIRVYIGMNQYLTKVCKKYQIIYEMIGVQFIELSPEKGLSIHMPFCNMCNLVVSKWKNLLIMGVEIPQQASYTRLGSGPREIICFWHFYFKHRLIRLRLRVATEKQTTLDYFSREGIVIALWWLNVEKVTFWLPPAGATLKANVSIPLYGWYSIIKISYKILMNLQCSYLCGLWRLFQSAVIAAELCFTFCGKMSGHWRS